MTLIESTMRRNAFFLLAGRGVSESERVGLMYETVEKTKWSEGTNLPDASWTAAGSEAPLRFRKHDYRSNCLQLSLVPKCRRNMELKEGPGRFATSFALPAQSIMVPQHPSWPSDVVGDV